MKTPPYQHEMMLLKKFRPEQHTTTERLDTSHIFSDLETTSEHDIFHLGKLEPLLYEKGLSDIYVNGPQEVWIEKSGTLQRTTITFDGEEEIRALATRLIVAGGGRLDESNLSTDITNPRGHRIHAVLPPLCERGTLLSIRVQPSQRFSLAELETQGMLDPQLTNILRYILSLRANFLISGGTGSGKTTLLNAMLSECQEHERLIIIEDSTELRPTHPHVISLQTRQHNSENKGEVTLSTLIRHALRMRPSRLVVGECRGAELIDMLTAMNTGHTGAGGTLHANSAQAVPARLMAMGAMGNLHENAVCLQADTAIDYIIHLSRRGQQRILSNISTLVFTHGKLQTRSLYTAPSEGTNSCEMWSEEGHIFLEQYASWRDQTVQDTAQDITTEQGNAQIDTLTVQRNPLCCNS
ncbi:TadA family conjugal transfer-associated ATPase [Rothia sp. CCM 9419]|uniref:TadA family conjugal transfer-associated ATPase n=1 Tax=Rothia sp. CCM 9419 TaxID=3402662 RepID=UPI003AE7333E